MRVAFATSAGRPGRPNEDFAGAVPHAVVLLDGAGIVGAESICHHGVAWYTHRLGGAVLGRLSRDDGRELAELLAESIAEVTDAHRDTCDVTNPSSPQATVALLRIDGVRAEYLLLADSYLVLDRAGEDPLVLTDGRELAVRHHLVATTRTRDELIERLRATRNQPGGYWLAKDDPRAATEAVTGSLELGPLSAVALASNGASRIVDRYAVATWPEVFATLREGGGPHEVLRRVRAAEDAAKETEPDDATIAFCDRLIA